MAKRVHASTGTATSSAVYDTATPFSSRVTVADSLAAYKPEALFAIKQLFHKVVDLPLAKGLEEGRKANIAMRALRT